MKKLVLLLAVLLIATWIGIKMAADPGYFLMAYGHWTIEMPLWLGIILLVVFLMMFHLIIKTFRYSAGIPNRLIFWRRQYSFRSAQNDTRKGLIALAEGYWTKAEKFLMRGANYSYAPLINYLAAAQAAQSEGEYQKRDAYLKKAHETSDDVGIAVQVTQAQLQMKAQQYEQALATLTQLHEIVPQHKYVLYLLYKLYLRLEDWSELNKILADLKKYKVLESQALHKVERKTYFALLQLNAENNQKIEFDNLWNSLPKKFYNESDFALLKAQSEIKMKNYKDAETYLRSFLKRQFNIKLIETYASFQYQDGKKQLVFLEKLISKNSQCGGLNFCLSQFCFRLGLWGKAKNYLEKAISLNRQSKYLVEMAKIFEKQHNLGAALDYYREAVNMIFLTKDNSI